MKIAFVPPVPALLPAYAGVLDPVADLRAAAEEAVGWLIEDKPRRVTVLHDPLEPVDAERGVKIPLGLRVARHLLDGDTLSMTGPLEGGSLGEAVLVMVSGSARRTEKAPGHLDPGSFAFDDQIESALADGDALELGRVNAIVGRQLLAAGIPSLYALTWLEVTESVLDYADDPFGVRYWVARWLCAD